MIIGASLGSFEGPTIREVVKGDLCTGCGTCVSLCPNGAIELVIDDKKGIYVPQLNEEKCNNCGVCYEVCPGHSVDFKQLNPEIFGKEPDDILIGNYVNCYIGHANDYEIRYNSAAGGLVTQLLIFALEEGIIDGALVTRMKKSNPLEPESFIARTREEIIESSKSKYCPVPANIALNEILESKDGEKFAVVGLPCHIHGIRKAELINEKLKEKIVLHLGIFCSVNRDFLATEYLLQKFNIKKEDVAKLDYRGEGWMGGELEMLSKSVGVEKDVRLTGLVEDHLKPLYHKASNVFCLPSMIGTECYPLTTLEAMTCGVPIVASKIGGISDVVKDGENGLLVPPRDSGALANAIIYLLENEEIGDKMGKNGREKVGGYSWAKIAEETEKVYIDPSEWKKG
jgi:coenzyme F420-reducing hydrogenase beta subunit